MSNNNLTKIKKQEEKIKDFLELLEGLDGIDEKKKSLWHTIFSQAMEDRNKAEALFSSIFEKIEEDSSNHAILGTPCAKYIERLSISNSQILELAKLVEKATENQKDTFNPDDIMSQINKK